MSALQVTNQAQLAQGHQEIAQASDFLVNQAAVANQQDCLSLLLQVVQRQMAQITQLTAQMNANHAHVVGQLQILGARVQALDARMARE